MDADTHDVSLFGVVFTVVLYRFKDIRKIGAEEHRDDCGRRFVRAETVVVACGGDGDTQHILIFIDRLDNGAQEEQKLSVLIGGFARLKQVYAGVGRYRPVIVFAAAVDPGKGLFVEQAYHAVLSRHTLHDLHGQLILIGRQVDGGIDGSKLMLGRRHLIVLRFGKDSQLPQLGIQLLHERGHARLDGAEIMVVQLLPLRRLRAEERAARVEQVLALIVKRLVDEEIFLLRADRRAHSPDGGVAEELQNAQALLVDGLHGAQQRRFLVERLAAVGTERGRDIEHMILDEREGRRVPCGVASGLKRGAQTAGGEAGRVRLALNQLLAGKLHDNAAACGGRDERVVLLRRDAGHGLEPVGKMRRAELNGPVLHGIGHNVGRSQIEPLALVDSRVDVLEDLLRQLLLHNRFAEYVTTKEIRYRLHKKSLTFLKKAAKARTEPKLYDAFAVYRFHVSRKKSSEPFV